MRKSATFLPSPFTALLLVAVLAPSAFAQVDTPASSKLCPLARAQASRVGGWSHVIVRTTDAASGTLVGSAIEQIGGRLGRRLPAINGRVAYIPNAALAALAGSPSVERIWLDRRVGGVMERTGATVGATHIRERLGYDGAGVGVAIIDSGVTSWHDDLTGGGAQRVYRFVDFVNGQQMAYDDYGHGTHVAGVIAGNGFDSGGSRSGIAPGAHLIVLKTLDAAGGGRISDVIAALDYVVANKDALNIRVVNLSVAAGVYESYDSDPLTLAAKRAVNAGIVAVAAAGNIGRNANGRMQYGGVTAPGNAPWVLTVGASSHMGTVRRSDDTVAAFSSRGPTAVDHTAKPDLVAPGVGIESLSEFNSAFYTSKSPYLLGGTVPTTYLPYLSLSGTSVAAPVVSGTVAVMLQANPALTPNQVKAILQYTSEIHRHYDPLTQGAGFLNAKGAVELAQYFAAPWSADYPSSSDWGKQLIWANHRIRSGRLTPDANAWATDVTWGAALTPSGQNVEWGVIETDGTWQAWASACADPICSTFAWGVGHSPNVVWGARCDGADCDERWSVDLVASSDHDTVVWGTAGGDTVVWGTRDADTVVWGTDDDTTVVWGTSDVESVVWETAADETGVPETSADDASLAEAGGDETADTATSDSDPTVAGNQP